MSQGDWLPMRLELDQDPTVLALVNRCDGVVDSMHAVGILHRIWSWFHRNADDCHARGTTPDDLERYVGVTGVAQVLLLMKWLEVTPEGVRMTKPDNWNSSTARSRLTNAARQAKFRGNNKTVTPTVTNVTPNVTTDRNESVTQALPEPLRERYPESEPQSQRNYSIPTLPGIEGEGGKGNSEGVSADAESTDAEKASRDLRAKLPRDWDKLPVMFQVQEILRAVGVTDAGFTSAVARKCGKSRERIRTVVQVCTRAYARRTRIDEPGAWIRTALKTAGIEL
jgi:hypothetical protein